MVEVFSHSESASSSAAGSRSQSQHSSYEDDVAGGSAGARERLVQRLQEHALAIDALLREEAAATAAAAATGRSPRLHPSAPHVIVNPPQVGCRSPALSAHARSCLADQSASARHRRTLSDTPQDEAEAESHAVTSSSRKTTPLSPLRAVADPCGVCPPPMSLNPRSRSPVVAVAKSPRLASPSPRSPMLSSIEDIEEEINKIVHRTAEIKRQLDQRRERAPAPDPLQMMFGSRYSRSEDVDAFSLNAEVCDDCDEEPPPLLLMPQSQGRSSEHRRSSHHRRHSPSPMQLRPYVSKRSGDRATRNCSSPDREKYVAITTGKNSAFRR